MSDKDIHSDILDRVGRQSGMTVPEGFFDSFAERMKQSLPEQEWERGADEPLPAPRPSRTLWHAVRPYVYMAAMFAGIWLMMNVSTLVGTGGDASVLAPADAPTLADLIDANETEFDEYVVDNYDRIDLYDDLYASGFNPVNLAYEN